MARSCVTKITTGVAMDHMKTINSIFEDYTAQFPSHIAVIHDKKALTYHELNQKANQLAHYLLLSLDFSVDTPIALCLERSFDFLVAMLAILKIGCAYLPIDPTQPEERLLFLLNDSKAPLLITQTAFVEQFSQYQGEIVNLDIDKDLIRQQLNNNLHEHFSTEQLAYIIYTSGSTGAPKGVLIEHRSVINYCHWFASYTQCHPQQRIDFSASPIFDMAVSVSLVPLMLGLTIVICEPVTKKDPKAYLHYLAQGHINIIKITPSYFKLLIQQTKHHFTALPHLETLILGGENLAAIDCKAWLNLYPKHLLHNEYGPTEATVAVSAYSVQQDSFSHFDANVPIGTMGPQVFFYVIDQQNKPVAEGEPGELAVGGICLARGYLNRADLTQKQFIKDSSGQRLYKTGDLCKQRADGVLEYLGRIDDQVKIRGFRVEPGEVENCLSAHFLIQSVAVVSQKDSQDEQQLVAYYTADSNTAEPTTRQLRDFLEKQIPDYMIPAAFMRVDFLPLTANGKLDKAALPEPKIKASQHYVEPVTALEKQLAQIWSEELGVELVGLQDNFFELGGHSLSAARLVSKINHELEKNITLYDFYKTACIADLIPIIKQTKKTKKILINEKNIKTTPLSDFQFVLWMADTFEPKAKRLNITARKRIQGHLDKEALEFAFHAILKKHEVLIYHIFKLQPKQKAYNNLSIKLNVQDISTLSPAESQQQLEQSLLELDRFKRWQKKSPLIKARLFYLNQQESELQICMPHLITDQACIDILFADLSKFYQQKQDINKIETDTHFKKYILTEQQLLKNALDKDINFWEKYLEDASFFSFPKKYIVSNMKKAKLPYSTYMQIPESTLNKLKHFCEQKRISINNGLCTTLALALRHCNGRYRSDKPFAVMNIIKSTRDNPIYDHSLGCFLRVEPVKIDLTHEETVENLSKQIQQSMIETSRHQYASNLIKLSSISSLNVKRKKIQNSFIKLITPIFSQILQAPLVYRKILQRSINRLMLFKRNHHFIVNLNVHHDFINPTKYRPELFGFKEIPLSLQKTDLFALDYIFEACFLYDVEQQAHYLVISANLTPEFKEQIASEFIQIINSMKD